MRYVKLIRQYEEDDYWWDKPQACDNVTVVEEDGLEETGLLWEDGSPVMRYTKNPIGFGKDEEWF